MSEPIKDQNINMANLEKLAAAFEHNEIPPIDAEKDTQDSALHLEGLTDSLKNIDEENRAVTLIVSVLTNNPTIKTIYLANNTFTESNAQKIMRAIENHPNIERINLNHFPVGKLANAIPFLENMATNRTIKELYFENTFPTADLASVATLTDNALPDAAKQFLAVNYLYEEVHDEPIHLSEDEQEFIVILDGLEKRSIEQNLMQNHDTVSLNDTAEFVVHHAEDSFEMTNESTELENTGEFIVQFAEDEKEESNEQRSLSYTDERDDTVDLAENSSIHETQEFVVEYAPTEPDDLAESVQAKEQEKAKHHPTDIKIKSIKELEKLCSMMELQQADSLNDKDTNRLLKIKKIDIDGLYSSLSTDEREEMIHLIVTIAESAPYVEKVYLANNDFSAADLTTILRSFSKAKENPDSHLRKMDFAHSIARKDLETVANDLGKLQDKLGKDLYLDRHTRRELRGLVKILQKDSDETMSSYQSACQDYREYLERKIILPAFRQNKLLRESYSAKDDDALIKKIMRDLTSTKSHAIKALKNDTEVRMAVDKHQIIRSLENIANDNRLSPNNRKAKFDARYYQEKKELPQLLLKNDKSQYIAFLSKIGDTKALNNIKELGYVAKSRKPKKYFFEETRAHDRSSQAEKPAPTTARPKTPMSHFFKPKEKDKDKTEKLDRPKTAVIRPQTARSKNRR
jgi:hypothetical protein